jgi:ubiquinone/menaquinone biosynthesis C-methylase UbiE
MKKSEFVKNSYDKIAAVYHSERDMFDNWAELTEFASILPSGGHILDVGCGSGVPVCKYLADAGFTVTGIDFSEAMIDLARKHVSGAEFIRMDMSELDFPENSFDGIAAFYSVFHIPRNQHLSLFSNFHRMLKPEAVMLVSMGSTEWEGTEDFHGEPMWWSHYGPAKSLRLIKSAGFEIIFERNVFSNDEKHYWILARKIKSI